MASNLNYGFWVKKQKFFLARTNCLSRQKNICGKFSQMFYHESKHKKISLPVPKNKTERSFLADFSVFHIKQVFPAQITADSILDAGAGEKCLQAFNAFHEVFLPLAIQF